ncbi:MAG: hypothetical protein PHX72_02590 [Candidatus Shapirobacteria bacterium]|nr:hypothetical protein [Candidatus Shapirobacteria bacterium]
MVFNNELGPEVPMIDSDTLIRARLKRKTPPLPLAERITETARVVRENLSSRFTEPTQKKV